MVKVSLLKKQAISHQFSGLQCRPFTYELLQWTWYGSQAADPRSCPLISSDFGKEDGDRALHPLPDDLHTAGHKCAWGPLIPPSPPACPPAQPGDRPEKKRTMGTEAVTLWEERAETKETRKEGSRDWTKEGRKGREKGGGATEKETEIGKG